MNMRESGSFNTDDADRPKWGPNTKFLARYEYLRADGRHAYFIDKGINPDGEKVFRCRRLNLLRFGDRLEPEDKFDELIGKGDQPWILYRLPELIAAPPDRPVHVCEGEKDVETLRGLGHVATTNPCGALKWRDEFSEYLADRDVVILPDNDQRGRAHARQVRDSVYDKARYVRIVELPGLPEKGDVTDWLMARRAGR